MKVMKFGGAVLSCQKGFMQMSAILSRLEESVVVVVSAFANSTRLLETAAEYAKNGEREAALSIGGSVISANRDIAATILDDDPNIYKINQIIDEIARQLENVLRGVAITKQLTGRTLDLIRSFGELLALHIARQYLEKSGISATVADAVNYIVTNDAHGAAEPLLAPTARRIEAEFPKLLDQFRAIVIQGYAARGVGGEITTMGKESSNLTATLLGEALNAEEVIIWTDTEGIYTADPVIAPSASPILAMSRHDAKLAAANGVKPIYATMIEPVKRADIPLIFRSAFRPAGNYTVIDDKQYPRPQIIAAASPDNNTNTTIITLINIEPKLAFIALQNMPAELLDEKFKIEIGITPEVQRITTSTALSGEAVRYFHKAIIESNTTAKL